MLRILPSITAPGLAANSGAVQAEGAREQGRDPIPRANSARVDPKKPATLVELRFGGGDKGAQAVFPGSTHPSGERVEWALSAFREADARGPLRKVLAKNMRRLRATCGLSQEALAHECGINRTYLSGWNVRKRNVSIDNIARIARGLNVDPWKLLKEDWGDDPGRVAN